MRHKKSLSPEEIEAGLTSESIVNRYAWARNHNFKPSAEQIKRGLTDKDPSIRFAFLNRRDIDYTIPQIKRALKDRDDLVRERAKEMYPEWESKMLKNKHVNQKSCFKKEVSAL